MQVADKERKMEKFGRYSSQSLWYSKMLTFFSCVPCNTEMKQSIMTDNNQVAAVTRIRESYYFKSFQGTHSIVLMAVAGSQYLFCLNVGTLWRLLVMGKFSKTAPLANNCMRASSLCLGQLCNQGEKEFALMCLLAIKPSSSVQTSCSHCQILRLKLRWSSITASVVPGLYHIRLKP